MILRMYWPTLYEHQWMLPPFSFRVTTRVISVNVNRTIKSPPCGDALLRLSHHNLYRQNERVCRNTEPGHACHNTHPKNAMLRGVAATE